MSIALKPIIQAVLFSSPHPIKEEELYGLIQKEHPEIENALILEALKELQYEYQTDKYGIEIQQTGSGYSFVSKAAYYPYIVHYIETIQKRRLSKSALETLSIIAFQPDCTKLDMETIRGVSSDYAIERLLERELIEISGRKDTPGHPTTYRTTEKFLDYFGIHSIEDLPRLTDIQVYENELGTPTEETNAE
ncbi:MAG: SMC-Scp complex subunit ScpB [Chitinophagales bacterium]|jgi:segregation and condensation protein B|nr:SMC-Scp complex subunit ScpB [Sphingobacteriales bacterium]